MKRESFKSKKTIFLVGLGFVIAILFLGYKENNLDYVKQAPVESAALIFGLLALVAYIKISTYLEIVDNRRLINSGYRIFGKDKIDIFDIKYIYRYPNFIIRYYGSRMVFYIKGEDGKLTQSSLREVNYSNDTLRDFLKRIKQIKPSIELDPEYEKFLEEKLYLEDASENTVASIEVRLKDKGEKWK